MVQNEFQSMLDKLDAAFGVAMSQVRTAEAKTHTAVQGLSDTIKTAKAAGGENMIAYEVTKA